MDDQEKFECPICHDIFKDPVLTRCGHRFCNSCLLQWFSEGKTHCPLDDESLDQAKDVFPDNYTKRQISDLKKQNSVNDCPSDEESCPYENVGCLERGTSSSISSHLKTNICEHMQLVLRQFEQLKENKEKCQNCCKHTDGCISAEKDVQQFNDKLLLYFKDIYEKLTKLDQCSKEYAIKIEQCTNELNIARNALAESKGLLLWEITEFNDLLNKTTFSPPFSTSTYGYRFCIRLTLSKTNNNSFALFLHTIKGNYDHVLTWPFVGEVTISVVHPDDSNVRLTAVIKANYNSEAFNRPNLKINHCGYGFREITSISELREQGFLQNNKLVILAYARATYSY